MKVYLCYYNNDCESHDPFAIFLNKEKAIKFADDRFTYNVLVYEWETGKYY